MQTPNVGRKRHGYAQMEIGAWFIQRRSALKLQPISEIRTRISLGRVRIPDVVLAELPLPDEEVFTTPPYLCIEIMPPDDTMASMQDRLDDYIAFGIPNIWVIACSDNAPWKNRGWTITADGWTTARDLLMRTHDGRVAMPLADVLLP